MARRRSMMANRMARMRGLPYDERQMLIRIGEIIDGAINNRTPTNPFEPGTRRGRSDPRLPPINSGSLTAEEGVKSVVLEWAPVNSSILLYYKVKLENKGTGEKQEFISYTNRFVFKGETGNYKANISTVGRNGTAAAGRELDFAILESVMFLEGNKNGVETVGTILQESIYVPQGYQVHVWASFVNNTFSDPATGFNPIPTIQLSRGVPPGASDSSSVEVIQQISLYPETETPTNYDDGSAFWSTPIDRPEADVFNPIREGNFQTVQSIMFDAFILPLGAGDQNNTFFVEVLNRETPEEANTDVVSLSMVVWVASGGLSDFVPGEIVASPGIGDDFRSVEFNGGERLFNIGGNKIGIGQSEDPFTVGLWLKRIGGVAGNGSIHIVDMRRDPDSAPYTGSNQVVILQQNVSRLNLTAVVHGTASASDVTIRTLNNLLVLNKWVYYLFRFDANLGTNDPRDQMHIFEDGVELSGNDLFATRSVADVVTTDTARRVSIGGDALLDPPSPPGDDPVSHDPDDDVVNIRVYQVQIWDKWLEDDEIVELYALGNPRDLDLNEDFGDYVSSSDLQHWYRCGFDEFNVGGDESTNSTLGTISLDVNSQNITFEDDVVDNAPPD